MHIGLLYFVEPERRKFGNLNTSQSDFFVFTVLKFNYSALMCMLYYNIFQPCLIFFLEEYIFLP